MYNIFKQVILLIFVIYQEFKNIIYTLFKLFKLNLNLYIFHGVKVKILPNGYIAKKVFLQQHLLPFKQSFEYKTFSIIKSHLKPDTVILDIGANIGIYSLALSKLVNIKSKIYAFEPSTTTFKIFEENIKINNMEKIIHPFNLALSDKAGILFLDVPNDVKDIKDRRDVFNSLTEESISEYSEQVNVITLDMWVENQDLRKLDLIKIDIEGAELLCFRGGYNVIKKFRPTIIMECTEDYCKRFNYTLSDMIVFFNSLNYSIFQYEEAQWIATPN